MTREEKYAKEKMYADVIVWICSTQQQKITREDLFEWIDRTGHNQTFKGKYCGGANKIKEALLNRADSKQTALILKKLLF